jgi:hypothetical protein
MDFSSAVLTIEFPEMIIRTVLLRGLIERAALRAGKHNRDLRSTGHPPNTRPRFGRFRDRRRREHNVNLLTFANRQPSYSSTAGHIGVQDGTQTPLSDNFQRGLAGYVAIVLGCVALYDFGLSHEFVSSAAMIAAILIAALVAVDFFKKRRNVK